MNQKLIFLPLLAQVLLTAVVFFRMYHARVNEMRNKRIHPQKIATASSLAEHLVDSSRISDNFSNQFEMPVLFYILTICLYVTQSVNMVFLVMTNLFVLSRIVHSLIHCGYNKVVHRFYAYAAGSILLWIMWLLFALELFNQ